jgi:hypothetical protein
MQPHTPQKLFPSAEKVFKKAAAVETMLKIDSATLNF